MIPRLRLSMTALLALAFAGRGSAQAGAVVELVRCATGSDAPCFRTRTAVGGRVRTFGVSADAAPSLGRSSTSRLVTLQLGGHSDTRVIASWRPPLLAMPAFRGVADSADLTPALREALLFGNFGGSDRPAIAVLVAIVLGFAWRLVWRVPAVAAGAGGGRGTTTRTGMDDRPEEGDPRSPDDVTKVTARHTALRR